MPLKRSHARLLFAARHLGSDALRIEPASSDASFRTYWRVISEVPARTRGRASADARASLILMDAPPSHEDVGPWLDIDARLRAAGLHAPEVFAADPAQGLVLIEDLGTRTYLPELDATTVDGLYADALDALLAMQTRVDTNGFPHYDRTRLVAEMELLPEWFLRRHLGFEPDCDEWDVIEAAFTFLVHAALEQPRAFVHRDYHSRNLLITDGNRPGIIDFQDALAGPVTYDLASLLRDCYIAWDIERVDGWVESHRRRLAHAHLIDAGVDGARFRRWFDLIGLQRHLKVLGIFCRLWYRDGKAAYLAELPRVWRYMLSVAAHYPELADFIALLRRALGDHELTQARAEAQAGTGA